MQIIALINQKGGVGKTILGWETSTTNIKLVLSADNYKVDLGIGYESKELKEWADKIKEEKAKSEF